MTCERCDYLESRARKAEERLVELFEAKGRLEMENVMLSGEVTIRDARISLLQEELDSLRAKRQQRAKRQAAY